MLSWLIGMAGLRVFYLEANFKMKLHLLAFRPVRPDPTDDRRVIAEVLKMWVV